MKLFKKLITGVDAGIACIYTGFAMLIKQCLGTLQGRLLRYL